jgi:hypothetical protein
MKFDWGKFKIKLTSRKFWLAIAGFVTLIMTAKGFDEGSKEQVTSIIMAGAAVVAYIIGEGLADSGVKNDDSIQK